MRKVGCGSTTRMQLELDASEADTHVDLFRLP